MAKKKTTNEYVLELNNKYPNLELIGEYQGASVKMLHRCRICGNERMISPRSLFQTKHGCPTCYHNLQARRQTMTHAEFISRLNEINPNIEITSVYAGSNNPISCKCLIDGNVWTTTPAKLLYARHGCPVCGGSLRIWNHEFLKRVKAIAPNIDVLEPYINSDTKVMVKCKICGYKWGITPSHIYSGRGCPKCAQERKRNIFAKSHDEFKNELHDINPAISVIGHYVNSKTKVECMCKICGRRWSAIPINLLKGKGCPRCAASNGEKKIEAWLYENNIKYIPEMKFDSCKFKRSLPFDFYIPDLQMCIEYDGPQHFKAIRYSDMTLEDSERVFNEQKQRDCIKEKYCSDNNISLIRIPYWDFDNINSILEKHLIY